MLSFMRWTHRNYPYGPVWLGVTIPLSYLGLNYFLPTFFLFKAFIAGAFLGVVWLIQKIVQETKTVDKKAALVFFALNPFVLIESVVSAHVDIVMIFFLLLGIYFLVKKKYGMSYVGFLLSYGVKFASTAYSLPIHIGVIIGFAVGLYLFAKIQKKLSWSMWFIIFGLFMIIPVVLASVRSNFQPWYLLSLFPFFAFVSNKKYIWIPLMITSFAVLFEYVPYLYVGNWDPPIPLILNYITFVTAGVSVGTSLFLLKFGKHD
jgi:hypothetical protein